MAVIEYDNQKELMLSGEDKLTNVPQEFIIVTNMTDDTVYVSKDPDIADRLDDNEVMVVEPGCSGCNPNSWGLSDHCYFLGSGRVGIEFISNEHGGLCRALLLTAKSMKSENLLDNPDFHLNQRGQSIYTGISAYTYTVDRWCIWKYNCDNYGTITVNNDGSLAVDGTMGADDAILTQTMEYGAALVGKTVTLSLEVSEINGTISIQQHKNVQSTLNISAPGVHKITFDWDNSSNRIVINNTNCTHYTVKWIKLELGGAATPFALPDPAAELLRCQRYFTIYKHQNATSSTDKCTIGVGYALTSSIVYAVLPIAAMRSGVTATISHSGLSLISGADTVVDYTSVTALEQTDSTVQVAFTVSGQTPGSVYRLRLMNSDAYLAVSKEL